MTTYTTPMTPLIYPGKVCKNYPEVCRTLGERVTTGGARRNQEARWTEYFEWYKKGNAYNFVRVKKPYQPPPAYVATGRYNKHLAPLLCNQIAAADQAIAGNELSLQYKQLILPSSELYVRLGICNNHFKEWKNAERFLRKFEIECLTTIEAREAYFTVWSFIWKTVDNAIASLVKQHFVARQTPAFQVKHRDAPEKLRLAYHDKDERVNEAQRIHLYYKDILVAYKCKNLFDVQVRSLEEPFYADLANLLEKELNIIHHTKVYHLFFENKRTVEIQQQLLKATEANEIRIRLQQEIADWAEENLDAQFWDILDIVFSPKK